MTLAIRCSSISLPASVPRFAIPTSWFVGVVKSSSLSPDFASARKPPRSPRAFSPLFPENPSRSRGQAFLCTVPSPSVGPLSLGIWIRPSTSTTKKSSPLPTAPSIKPRIPAATRPLALSIRNPPPNHIPPSPTAIPKLASPNSPPPPLTSPPTASKPLPSPDPFSPNHLTRKRLLLVTQKVTAFPVRTLLPFPQSSVSSVNSASVPFVLEHLNFHNGPIELHAVAAGREDAPVVLLLHGFPEFWYSWHRQIEPLASAGFRVIVPDQRGYNTSSKPRGISSYALSHLVSDVLAIADQLSQQRIFLAGHDWGAAVAWSVALLHPHRVSKLAILNVPHPSVMRRFLKTNRRQLRRSWYMFFFQLPWLPEAAFRAFHFRLGVRSLVRSSREGTFSPDDLEQYRAAWSQPGALTAMIHWYRAAFR